MKAALALALLAAIGFGAWFMFNQTDTDTTDASLPESEPVAVEEVEETAETVDDTSDEPVTEDVESEVDEVKTQVEDAVDTAKEVAEEKVDDAVEAVDQAAEAIKNESAAAVEETTEKVQSAIEKALGSTAGAADTTADDAGAMPSAEAEESANLEHDAPTPVTEADLDAALSVEGFDGIAIRNALEGMDLDALTRTSVEALVVTAEENPDQIQDVVGKIREALGL